MTLSNEVECDEAYVVAGHKGHPEVVKSKGRKGRRRRRKGKAGRRVSKNARPESIFSARDLGLLAILVPQYLGQLIGFSA